MNNGTTKLQEAWSETDYANAIIGVCGQDFEKLRKGLSDMSVQSLKKLYTAIKGGAASEEDADPELTEISDGKELVQKSPKLKDKSSDSAKTDDSDDAKPTKKAESRLVSIILGKL